MRDTVSLSEFDTQIEPNPAVVSSGTSPTGIVAITAFVAGSIRDTAGWPPDRNSEFTTHTLPNPSVMPIGSPPTGIVAITSTVGGPDGDGETGLADDADGDVCAGSPLEQATAITQSTPSDTRLPHTSLVRKAQRRSAAKARFRNSV